MCFSYFVRSPLGLVVQDLRQLEREQTYHKYDRWWKTWQQSIYFVNPQRSQLKHSNKTYSLPQSQCSVLKFEFAISIAAIALILILYISWFEWDTQAFPEQMRFIIPSAHSESTLWMVLKRHPDRMPEPGVLSVRCGHKLLGTGFKS